MKCGLGVRRHFPRPDASPPRCAQLMGLASRGCLSTRAGRHSREEETSLPVRPWSAVDPYPRSTPFIQVKQQNELGRAFNGHLADPSPIPVRAHARPDRQHRRRYRPTSTSRSRRVGPLSCGRRSWTKRVRIADDPGRSADTPGARAGAVLHQKQRSQPTPVAVARCGNQHVGGGCCASSRSLP